MDNKAFFGADSLIYIVLGEPVFTGPKQRCERPFEPVDVYLDGSCIGEARLNECDHFACWVEPDVLAGIRQMHITPEIIFKPSPRNPQREEVVKIVLHNSSQIT